MKADVPPKKPRKSREAKPPKSAAPTSFLESPWLPWGLVAVAFLTRWLSYRDLGETPGFVTPQLDQRFYLEWSDRIREGALFGQEVFRGSPLYGYFVALVRSILGPEPSKVAFVQMVIGALTVGLIHRCAQRLTTPVGALIAAVLYILCWVPALYDLILVPSALAIFFSTLALDRLLTLKVDPPNYRSLLALAVILATASLLRERYFLFALFALAWCAWWIQDKKRWLCGLCLPLLACMGLPSLNNALASDGEFIPYTATGGLNFYIGNGPDANGRFVPPAGFRRGRDQMYEDAVVIAEKNEGRSLTASEVERYWFDRTFDAIKEEPGAVVSRLMMKLDHFTRWRESWDVVFGEALRQQTSWLRIPFLGHDVIAVFGWAGLVLLLIRRRAGLLHGLSGAHILFVLLFFTGSRFRTGMYIPLSIAAGFLLSELWTHRRNTRDVLRYALLAGVMAIVVFARPAGDEAAQRRSWATWYSNEGRDLFHRRRFVQARTSFEKALEYDENYATPHGYLGRLRLDTGDYESAAEHFARASELEPQHLPHRMGHATALRDLKKHREALSVVREVLAQAPDHPHGNFFCGLLLTELRRPSEARPHLEKVANHPRFGERARRLLSSTPK